MKEIERRCLHSRKNGAAAGGIGGTLCKDSRLIPLILNILCDASGIKFCGSPTLLRAAAKSNTLSECNELRRSL